MSSTETPSQLFEAYQMAAQDLLPPGLVLEGDFIVQTIGNFEHLLKFDVRPNRRQSVHELPDSPTPRPNPPCYGLYNPAQTACQ